MSLDITVHQAEQEAEELLKRLAHNGPPTDPFEIARKHDITTQAQHLKDPGFAGCLVKAGDNFGILYSTHINNDGFIRFTIAHELGHYFIPGHPEILFPEGNGQHFSAMGLGKKDQHEREADAFASSLLMPKASFRKEMNGAGQGFPAIKKLADKFQTSLLATSRRFVSFTEDAVAIIVSKDDIIEYSFLSRSLEEYKGIRWLKKGARVPTNTPTKRFNRTVANVIDCKQHEGSSTFDSWIDGAPELDVNEDIVGLGSYGRTLTILFTDEPLADAEDEESSEEDDLEF